MITVIPTYALFLPLNPSTEHFRTSTSPLHSHQLNQQAMRSTLRRCLLPLRKTGSFRKLLRPLALVALKLPKPLPLPSGLHCINGLPQGLVAFLEKNDFDPEEQERKANLGALVDEMRLLVPGMVHETLPKSIVLPDIMLRICPSHFDQMNAFLPNIKGHVSYYATCKALQLFMTSVVVNPNVQLHIQSLRTTTASDLPCVYPHSQKIIVRWTTCPEGCTHLRRKVNGSHKTGDAKLGSHRWSRIDTDKFVDAQENPYNWLLSSSLAGLTKGIIGLKKEEEDLERVVLGIFIFELNTKNDHIVAHTIEDMDVIERRELQGVDGKLRVC